MTKWIGPKPEVAEPTHPTPWGWNASLNRFYDDNGRTVILTDNATLAGLVVDAVNKVYSQEENVADLVGEANSFYAIEDGDGDLWTQIGSRNGKLIYALTDNSRSTHLHRVRNFNTNDDYVLEDIRDRFGINIGPYSMTLAGFGNE